MSCHVSCNDEVLSLHSHQIWQTFHLEVRLHISEQSFLWGFVELVRLSWMSWQLLLKMDLRVVIEMHVRWRNVFVLLWWIELVVLFVEELWELVDLACEEHEKPCWKAPPMPCKMTKFSSWEQFQERWNQSEKLYLPDQWIEKGKPASAWVCDADVEFLKTY